MTYREMAIETIRIACNDLIERAEEIVPDTEGLISTDVVMHIPSLTDDCDIIPTIKITTNAYTRRIAIEKISDMLWEFKNDSKI